MKNLEQRNEMVRLATQKLEAAVNAGDKQAIINSMNILENDPEFNWDNINESHFEDWDELTSTAHDILYS
jgi:hypothetical protein